jgi:hypothetical protein
MDDKVKKIDEPMTMVRLHQDTREKLKHVGNKGETYNEIMLRVLEENAAMAMREEENADELAACEERLGRLERIRKYSDETLKKLIVEAEAQLEEDREHREGRYYHSVKHWENDTVDELIWCISSMDLSVPERTVLSVLIDKELAEDELRLRTNLR